MVLKRPRTHKRWRSSIWILGGVLLGTAVDRLAFLGIPISRQLESSDLHSWTPTEYNSAIDDIHIVFSTGCSQSQNWQSYVFFYHAMRTKQPGKITRIASGCTKVQERVLAIRHKEEVFDKMSKNFHIHFTPDFSRVGEGKPYHYFNKPFGLRHWMEHELGFPSNHEEHTGNIIAVLDPDMILLKPLLNNFTTLPLDAWNSPKPKSKSDFQVRRGHPIAQQYTYMSHWKVGLGRNIESILGKESPVYNMSQYDANYHYPAGPPYILEAGDLYDIVVSWSLVAPAVHQNYPYLLAEMYGYSIAAAHHRLKHQLATGLMASNARIKEEGWRFLNDVSPAVVCNGKHDIERMPHILHYCQEYSVGDYHFTKYYIPNNFLSCESPLLLEPPRDAAVKFNTSRDYLGKPRAPGGGRQLIRYAFMACALLSYLNQASTFYKQNHCGLNANFNKTWSTFKVSAS